MTILGQHPEIGAALRVTQLIVLLLFLGVVLFLGVATFFVVSGRVEPVDKPLLAYVLLATGVMAITVVAILRSVILRQTRAAALRRDPSADPSRDPGQLEERGITGLLFRGWQTSTIMMAAAIEGAALMSAVAAIVEGQAWSIVAGGMFASLLLLYVPTTSRLEHHLEGEMTEIESARR